VINTVALLTFDIRHVSAVISELNVIVYSSIVEFNSRDYSRLSFLFVWNDFMFLVIS